MFIILTLPEIPIIIDIIKYEDLFHHHYLKFALIDDLSQLAIS